MLQLNLAVKIRYYDGCNELQQDLWISKFSRNTTLQRFVILELLLFPLEWRTSLPLVLIYPRYNSQIMLKIIEFVPSDTRPEFVTFPDCVQRTYGNAVGYFA